MKRRYLILTVSVFIIILLIIIVWFFYDKKETNIVSLPSLPNPIAEEYALITSAGQSTDVYIIYDIANKLMIHNFFMPQAEESDLEGIKTLVFTIGYSDLGEKMHGSSFETEKKRISGLLKKAKEENIAILVIYIGGKQQRNKNTDELLSLIAPNADYIIGTKEANHDAFLSGLAKGNRIPITLINEVNDLSEPFASAFR